MCGYVNVLPLVGLLLGRQAFRDGLLDASVIENMGVRRHNNITNLRHKYIRIP